MLWIIRCDEGESRCPRPLEQVTGGLNQNNYNEMSSKACLELKDGM